MTVTIRSIAVKLKTTPSTVSRALRDDPLVSAKTRARIKTAAGRMGYRPNLLARGLVKGKTGTIGLVIPSCYQPITAAKIVCADRLVTEAGYRLYVSYTRRELALAIELGHELISRGVDGLIVAGGYWGADPASLKPLLEFPVPTVFLDARLPFPSRQVYHDKASGVRAAVEHLITLGHREIHMFRGWREFWELDPRFTGFMESIEEHRLGRGDERVYEISLTDHVSDDGQAAIDVDDLLVRTETFLRSHPGCTAILCSDDEIAMALILALDRMGIGVPRDVSVVGVDNIAPGMYMRPPLSTVAQPVSAVVRTAVDLLFDTISSGRTDPDTVIIPTEFIARGSTGPVRSVPQISMRGDA